MTSSLFRVVPLSAVAIVAASPILWTAPKAKAQDAMASARAPGTHLLMRHAIAPGTGDPSDFELGDCTTQRNLSDEGREQARRSGTKLRENGVSVDIVLSSQWCRSRETAERRDLGPVADFAALNSSFRDRDGSAAQTAAVVARLADLDASGRKAVLVSHQVNISALSDTYPASGEVIIVSLDGNETITVEGRITTD